MNKENKEFLKNNSNAPTYSQIQSMLKEGKISKTHALELIKTREKIDKLQADLEYEKQKNKEITLGTIDVATAAIPIGGGAKIASKLAGKLTPKLGKKIAQSVAKNTIDGAKTGAVHGALTGVIDEDKNPVTQAVKEAGAGGIVGGAIGLGAGKIVQKIDGGNLNKPTGKNLFKASKKYYSDYERGMDVDNKDIGKIILASDAFKETLIQNPRFANKTIDLSKDLKTAKLIKTESPTHEHKKYKLVKFYTLKGKNANYIIAENSKGKRYFYKVADPKVTGPKPEPQSLPFNSIKDKIPDFNPSEAIYSAINNPNTKQALIKTLAVESPKLLDEKENKKHNQNNSSNPSKHINFNGISKDGIPWKNWSEKEQRGFLEGFIGKSLDTADKNKKGNWTDKFNIGNPDTDDGHWVRSRCYAVK